MDQLVIASSEADAQAAEAVERHHAEMAGVLAALVEALVAAAARRDEAVAEQTRSRLVHWCETELVPHALAEEKAMYPAARRSPEGRLLVKGMLAEHRVITGLVRRLGSAEDPVRAAADATALQVAFDSHLAKENDLVLPLLLGAADVSVAALLDGMHELLGAGEVHPPQEGVHEPVRKAESGCGGHSCSCGEVDGPGYPELDAREVPHAIRHATIFGALDAVRSGEGMVLVAPHDPLPLLGQLEQRAPGAFEVSYLERGPEAWRLAFVRRGPA
jgi:uncharacterized protein (DUF2249 family)